MIDILYIDNAVHLNDWGILDKHRIIIKEIYNVEETLRYVKSSNVLRDILRNSESKFFGSDVFAKSKWQIDEFEVQPALFLSEGISKKSNDGFRGKFLFHTRNQQNFEEFLDRLMTFWLTLTITEN